MLSQRIAISEFQINLAYKLYLKKENIHRTFKKWVKFQGGRNDSKSKALVRQIWGTNCWYFCIWWKASCNSSSYKHKGTSSVIFLKKNSQESLLCQRCFSLVLCCGWVWGSGVPRITDCCLVYWLLICICRIEQWFMIKLSMLQRRPGLCMCSFDMRESEAGVLNHLHMCWELMATQQETDCFPWHFYLFLLI